MPKKNANKVGVCPKCFKKAHLTRHHVLPKRFFGHNDEVLYICDQCHQEIEQIIPHLTRFKPAEYFALHKQWLMHKPVLAI